MVLSGRQRKDLNAAIAAYLLEVDCKEAATKESGTAMPVADEKKCVLERKWTSLLRLQTKVLDLEAKVEELTAQLSSVNPAALGKKADDLLPLSPATLTLKGHRDAITHIAIHPLYTLVASSSDDGSIHIWDYVTGELERTLRGHTDRVNCIAFSREKGTLLVSCSADLSIKLWDASSEWQTVKTMMGHDHNVSCVDFLPSGDHIVSCGRDQTVRVWEVATGYCIKTLLGHNDWVRSVSAHVEGDWIASCSADKSIRVWNALTGSIKGEFLGHSHVVECVCFPSSKDMEQGIRECVPDAKGPVFISGSRDKSIKLWDVDAGQCRMTLEGHDNWVRHVAFHPSGHFVMSASDDRTIRVWDLKTGRCLRVLEKTHRGFVSCVALNAGGSVMVTGGDDRWVKVWKCT